MFSNKTLSQVHQGYTSRENNRMDKRKRKASKIGLLVVVNEDETSR